MRKLMSVDRFVHWAVTEEWPKAAVDRREWESQARTAARRDLGFGGAAWAMMSEFETLGTLVDVNRYGMVPGDTGAMHWDAEVLFQLLVDLDRLLPRVAFQPSYPSIVSDWPADAQAMGRGYYDAALARIGDWGGVAGEYSVRGSALEMIRLRAVMGASDVTQEAPAVEVVKRRGQLAWFRRERFVVDGETIDREVDGYNLRAKRPYPDAYRKTVLDPDPTALLEDRIEHQLWVSLLNVIVAPLNRRLEHHEVYAPDVQMEPWCSPLTAAVA